MTSKLGPHCLRATDSAQRMLDAGCKVIKLVDDFGLADNINPNVTIIGRVYSSFTAESQRNENPASAADRFVKSQIEKYRANPKIRIWEGHNEPVWNNAVDMAWYAEFESYRVRLMTLLGYRCVIGNFSTGNPDLPLWNAFLPAIRTALANDCLLGLHEYSSPWMWWMTGKYQVDPSGNAGDTGWTTLRYRKVIRDYLKPAGVDAIPIVITECGLDRVGQIRPGMSSGNWRTNAGWWNAENSAEGVTPFDANVEKYYADQLIWYDRELQKDSSVVGATIFTVGSYGQPWSEYDIDGTNVVTHLVNHIKGSVSEVNTPPPIVVPPVIIGDPPVTNLLQNGSFGLQKYHNVPGQSSMLVPDFWNVDDFSTPEYPMLNKQDKPFVEPEIIVIEHLKQFPEDYLLYDAGDSFVLKIFKDSAPTWVQMSQTVNVPKGRYKLTVPIFPDQWHRVSAGQPLVRPSLDTSDDYYLASEIMLFASDARNSVDTEWLDAQYVPIGRYTARNLLIDHLVDGNLRIGFELRGRWGFQNNGWFIDGVTLEEIEVAELPPVVGGTPKLEVVRAKIAELHSLLEQVDANAIVMRDLIYSALRVANAALRALE